jgi:hypothetical protein
MSASRSPTLPCSGWFSQLLHDATVQLTGSDGPEADRLALQAWSLGHGIAMLMLDKRLPADDALIERLICAGSCLELGNGARAAS